MIIPEIREHLEDINFEDWLTATLIENASQLSLQDLRGAHHGTASPNGIADLWMVEITRRSGKMWDGKFQVEFTEDRSGRSQEVQSKEPRSGELLFTLNTESAEIIFHTGVQRRK